MTEWMTPQTRKYGAEGGCQSRAKRMEGTLGGHTSSSSPGNQERLADDDAQAVWHDKGICFHGKEQELTGC